MGFDSVILGGGYLGLTTAISLSNLGLNVAVVRKIMPKLPADMPGRLFAISSGTIGILKNHAGIDVTKYGGPINYIRVLDATGEGYLDFDPKVIESDNFGVMLLESDLMNMLENKVAKLDDITFFDDNFAKKLVKNNSEEIVIELDNGKQLSSKQLIVCEGKHSKFRDVLGIETMDKDYNQKAVVAEIWHEELHEESAVEYFYPSGPFAILPKKDGNRCSIVWTMDTEHADEVLAMDKQEQLMLIADRFGDYLGDIKLESRLAAFPLSLKYAKEYGKGRALLLGDSLHSIHPLAGQGLNLSFRDMDYLVNSVKKALSLGLDISQNAMIMDYKQSRKADNMALIQSTSVLNALFSNNSAIVSMIRNSGLNIVRKSPTLTKYFMKYAMEGF